MILANRNHQVVDRIFRTEYGKILAITTKFLGVSNMQMAEDIVQDTLIAAMTDWSAHGTPNNPSAWLVQVARRKALNELKRLKMIHHHHQMPQLLQAGRDEMDDILLDDEIKDSQLRMIFTCCHPTLNLESQITLTLKTLCGFGSREIAQALLTSASTINKRLYRAKESIRNSKVTFQVPKGKELLERLEAVSLTLYLLFNQGYHATSGTSMIQKELCLEAMRLTKLLLATFVGNHTLKALLSLMCLHAARFDARIDHKGALILFEDQDRTRWNQELIHMGMQYFQQSLEDKTLSTYHIEARIAAEHCLSKSFADTDWSLIQEQYKLLDSIKPSPIIKLNLAIIQSKLKGTEHSLHLLEALTQANVLSDYYLLPATLGIFSMKISKYEDALGYLYDTLKLNPSKTERIYIEDKIALCKEMIPTA